MKQTMLLGLVLQTELEHISRTNTVIAWLQREAVLTCSVACWGAVKRCLVSCQEQAKVERQSVCCSPPAAEPAPSPVVLHLSEAEAAAQQALAAL